MLLYISTGDPTVRAVRPLPFIPNTVNVLYSQAMREHVRPGVIQVRTADGWQLTPDWRFDRRVIRLALFLEERLGIEPGSRVAVFGPLSSLWLEADFAVQGLRAIAVGLHGALSDDQVAQALADTEPQVAFATDATSTKRLLELRPSSALHVIGVGGTLRDADAADTLEHTMEQGMVLDTAERAQEFRAGATEAAAGDVAGIHFTADVDGTAVRQDFTHAEAMTFVKDRLTACPARPEDVVYCQTEGVTLPVRLMSYALVGDGYSTMTLLGEHAGDVDLAELGPAKILADPAWIGALAEALEALRGWGRTRKARALLLERFGDRLRWIEPSSDLAPQAGARLAEAGLRLPG